MNSKLISQTVGLPIDSFKIILDGETGFYNPGWILRPQAGSTERSQP